MSKKIMISESELHDIIFEAVNNYMLNESEDEGLVKNLVTGWNAGKNAKVDQHKGEPKDAAGMIQNNLSQRFKAGVKGYKAQKKYTRLQQLAKELQQYVADGTIPNPDITVRQLAADCGALAQTRGKMQKEAGKNGYSLKKESIEQVVDKVLNEMLNK